MLKCYFAILNYNYLLVCFRNCRLFFPVSLLFLPLCCQLWEECGQCFPLALYSFPIPPSSCIPTDCATESQFCQLWPFLSVFLTIPNKSFFKFISLFVCLRQTLGEFEAVAIFIDISYISEFKVSYYHLDILDTCALSQTEQNIDK